MKKLLSKITMLAAGFLMITAMTIGTTQFAYADAKADVCAGVNVAGGSGCGGGEATISKIVKVVIQILSFVAGIAAVIMIIVAGLKFITSGGDSSGVASAKTALIYALVGLVVVVLAQVIVHFVLGKV